MNKYANFLRDFANANADSFEPEQIRNLMEAAEEIEAMDDTMKTMRINMDVVANERDNARYEVCELSGNGSCDSTEREAESRGWEYLFGNENPTYVCDHCGDTTDSDNVFHYAEVPQDIASANKGESATVCRKCNKMIEANANNDHFRRNHK